MRIDLIKEQDAGPPALEPVVPRNEILSHHEVRNPAHGAAHTVWQLGKIQTVAERFETRLEAGLDLYVK
jgi:hypothetical protein